MHRIGNTDTTTVPTNIRHSANHPDVLMTNGQLDVRDIILLPKS